MIIYVPRQYLNVVINLIVVIDLTVVFIDIVVKFIATVETFTLRSIEINGKRILIYYVHAKT